jgi:hypothetical protein
MSSLSHNRWSSPAEAPPPLTAPRRRTQPRLRREWLAVGLSVVYACPHGSALARLLHPPLMARHLAPCDRRKLRILRPRLAGGSTRVPRSTTNKRWRSFLASYGRSPNPPHLGLGTPPPRPILVLFSDPSGSGGEPQLQSSGPLPGAQGRSL